MLYTDLLGGIGALDELCRELKRDFVNLHGKRNRGHGFTKTCTLICPGLLCLLAGFRILDVTGSEAMAAGYLISACQSLSAIGATGVCQMLRTRYPDYIYADATGDEISIAAMMKVTPLNQPILRRAPHSTSNDTSNSEVQPEDDTNQAENLDTLTSVHLDLRLKSMLRAIYRLMRSSLALASEQDPQVLMATLLRVLCQYIRADYAAIALADPEDATVFRLVASGTYDRITTRDLSLAEENAHDVCPAGLMLKVARTGKVSGTGQEPQIGINVQPMTKISTSSGDWFDSFYGNRTPRTAMCLPISAQGRQAGVS